MTVQGPPFYLPSHLPVYQSTRLPVCQPSPLCHHCPDFVLNLRLRIPINSINNDFSLWYLLFLPVIFAQDLNELFVCSTKSDSLCTMPSQQRPTFVHNHPLKTPYPMLSYHHSKSSSKRTLSTSRTSSLQTTTSTHTPKYSAILLSHPRMCHTVQYLFTDCPDQPANSLCRGRTWGKHVEICPLHDGANPPWAPGYDEYNLPHCTPTVEYVFVKSMCHIHQNDLAVNGKADFFDVYAECHNTFAFGTLPDQRVWLIPQTPWADVHYREVEWNPIPRPVPLQSPPLSPTTRRTYTHPKTGVLNPVYHPSYWQTNDGRPLRPLQVPEEPPIFTHFRPPMPIPQLLTERSQDQLTDLVSEDPSVSEPPTPVLGDVSGQTEYLIGESHVAPELPAASATETSRKRKFDSQEAQTTDPEPRKKCKFDGKRCNSDIVLTPFSMPTPGGRIHWQSKRHFSSDDDRPRIMLRLKIPTNRADNIIQADNMNLVVTETERLAVGTISTPLLEPSAQDPPPSRPRIIIKLNLRSKPKSKAGSKVPVAARTRTQAKARKSYNPTTFRTRAVTRSQTCALAVKQDHAGSMRHSTVQALRGKAQ